MITIATYLILKVKKNKAKNNLSEVTQQTQPQTSAQPALDINLTTLPQIYNNFKLGQ